MSKQEFTTKLVMPGLVPGIHVLAALSKKDVDGGDKPGHDENNWLQTALKILAAFSIRLSAPHRPRTLRTAR